MDTAAREYIHNMSTQVLHEIVRLHAQYDSDKTFTEVVLDILEELACRKTHKQNS